jgi:microcystin-dependent protein
MSTPFLGEIRMFAGNFAPKNWQFCNGQTLPINQYSALFALLGTNFGGNGVSTFMLPDFRGRLPISVGQGPGLTNRVLGEPGGSENVTITSQTMPQHNHMLMVTTAGATLNTPSATALPAAETGTATGSFYALNVGSPSPTMGHLNTSSLAANGSSLAHTNLMPALCLSFIIAMQGLFPTRN